MALDAYSPCPCGSGNKFKWCCQPIHQEIAKAFQQDADGQHEAALVAIDAIATAHAGNPEVWGRKAELLYRNGKADEAEESLQKAFDINPKYPFGHLLRGSFRFNEGEIPGALLMFRKAADLFDPSVGSQLAQVYALIGECELKMNRPLAMHAALRIALHFDRTSEELQNALQSYFGENSQLPEAVRRDYKFQSAPATLPADRRAAWEEALAGAATGKLSDATRMLSEVAQGDPQNPAAWYNLTLVRAWLGDNAGALESLERYVNLETDEARAAEAWALGEALRLGYSMESQADVIDYSILFRIVDPRVASSVLQEWHTQRRLIVLQAPQDKPIFSGMVLEKPAGLTVESGNTRLPRLGAYIFIVSDRLRISNTNREALGRLREELMQKIGSALADEQPGQGPANFAEVLTTAATFPIDITDQVEAEKRVREEFGRYFEETWIHQPLRSLGNVPPIDAAGHPQLKKKLMGVLQFLEETAAVTKQPYEFDRLRRKLGLAAGAAPAGAAPSGAAPAAAAPSGPEIGSLGVPELAALNLETLNDEQLELGYQSSLKLDARDVAGKFAKALVARPPQPGKTDRYPWYSHLVQLSLAESNTDAALDYVNEGEKADCEQNEGRRRNDYELRRGQIHAKRGEADQAQDVFERLIDREPSELKFRGSATEAMLSARQGGKALKFAEGGLAKAREQNNRDSEQYFLELLEAAKRQSN